MRLSRTNVGAHIQPEMMEFANNNTNASKEDLRTLRLHLTTHRNCDPLIRPGETHQIDIMG